MIDNRYYDWTTRQNNNFAKSAVYSNFFLCPLLIHSLSVHHTDIDFLKISHSSRTEDQTTVIRDDIVLERGLNLQYSVILGPSNVWLRK